MPKTMLFLVIVLMCCACALPERGEEDVWREEAPSEFDLKPESAKQSNKQQLIMKKSEASDEPASTRPRPVYSNRVGVVSEGHVTGAAATLAEGESHVDGGGRTLSYL